MKFVMQLLKILRKILSLVFSIACKLCVCVTLTRNMVCMTYRPTKKLPNRLPKYPVPERLKKCVVENKDVATIVPCLLKVSTGVLLFLALNSIMFFLRALYICMVAIL